MAQEAAVGQADGVVEEAAGRLVEVMFGADGMPWGTKFSQLEQRALQLGQALSRQIMRRCVAQQAATEVPEPLEACPSCGGLLKAGESEPRVMTSGAGEVAWCEPQRLCLKCRKSFFPSVEGTGD